MSDHNPPKLPVQFFGGNFTTIETHDKLEQVIKEHITKK